jgi:hypothetical protein
MKYLTKVVVLNCVTLLMSCYSVPNAAQTIIASKSYAITTRLSVASSQETGDVVGVAFVSSQNRSLTDIQLGNHVESPGDCFGLTQTVCSGVTLQDKDTKISFPAHDAISGTNSSPPGAPARNGLRLQVLEYFSRAERLPPDYSRTVASSFVNINEHEHFDIVQAPQSNRNQARQIDGLSTEAWTTIVGWHPSGPVFQDPSTYEPGIDHIFIDDAYQ